MTWLIAAAAITFWTGPAQTPAERARAEAVWRQTLELLRIELALTDQRIDSVRLQLAADVRRQRAAEKKPVGKLDRARLIHAVTRIAPLPVP